MPRPIIEEIDHPGAPEDLFAAIKDLPYSFFLDSSLSSQTFADAGRYSFLGGDPFLVFKSKGDRIMLEWRGGKIEHLTSDPFIVLKDLFDRYRVDTEKEMPFTAGGVGYFSYDLKRFIEELPDAAKDDLHLYDCVMGFYDCVITFDILKKKAYLSSLGLPERENRLKYFRARIALARAGGQAYNFRPSGELRSNFSKEAYIDAIEKAKEYIRRGDIYQVNLSQRFEVELKEEPFALYSRLRKTNPAPFSSYLNFDDLVIASSSPERFLMKRGDYIETRPIKGTRPRGRDASEDAMMERELLASPKDAAEHLMIVDLERNDLGRICEYGSVKVSELNMLERYSTVFHLVSVVSGKLTKGIGPIDCMEAAFPGGSITGAPKIRSMEIIEELEPVKRSVYTGAIGYISFDGSMDTSIAIRTFVISGGKAYFQAGGGIVADSDPEREYEETIHKVKGLFSSLGIEEKEREIISI
ncbi:MAG: aminodeoxychorismate synthase component I [Candidatus Omnitrophota bacterium]|jgi:para-aminobenzoate synthetase component 1